MGGLDDCEGGLPEILCELTTTACEQPKCGMTIMQNICRGSHPCHKFEGTTMADQAIKTLSLRDLRQVKLNLHNRQIIFALLLTGISLYLFDYIAFRY